MTTRTHPTSTPSDPFLPTRLAGKYMTFRLASEDYGIEILAVREIIRLMDITRVPGSDPCIRGVINLRGRVIPVLDLRSRFQMSAVEATDQTVIIVVQCDGDSGPTTMGLLVDEVLEVLSLGPEAIEAVPELGDEELATAFILGIGKAGKRVLFLLDVGRVLPHGERPGAAAGSPAFPSEPIHSR